MGRRKISIEPILHERNRSVTFLKRKNGLFKKAFELGVLCSVDVAVIIFDRPGHNTKLYQYSSGDIHRIAQRHLNFDGEKDTRGPSDFGSSGPPRDDDDSHDEPEVDLDAEAEDDAGPPSKRPRRSTRGPHPNLPEPQNRMVASSSQLLALGRHQPRERDSVSPMGKQPRMQLSSAANFHPRPVHGGDHDLESRPYSSGSGIQTTSSNPFSPHMGPPTRQPQPAPYPFFPNSQPGYGPQMSPQQESRPYSQPRTSRVPPPPLHTGRLTSYDLPSYPMQQQSSTPQDIFSFLGSSSSGSSSAGPGSGGGAMEWPGGRGSSHVPKSGGGDTSTSPDWLDFLSAPNQNQIPGQSSGARSGPPGATESWERGNGSAVSHRRAPSREIKGEDG